MAPWPNRRRHIQTPPHARRRREASEHDAQAMEARKVEILTGLGFPSPY
jgi:hypothetical protein